MRQREKVHHFVFQSCDVWDGSHKEKLSFLLSSFLQIGAVTTIAVSDHKWYVVSQGRNQPEDLLNTTVPVFRRLSLSGWRGQIHTLILQYLFYIDGVKFSQLCQLLFNLSLLLWLPGDFWQSRLKTQGKCIWAYFYHGESLDLSDPNRKKINKMASASSKMLLVGESIILSIWKNNSK